MALVGQGVKISMRQGIILSVPFMAFFMIFPHYIAGVFLGEGASAESVDYVVNYIWLCVPFIVCQIINNLFHNFYRGVMKPGIATLTTAVYTVFRIATTYALVWNLGMLGVFLGFVIPWLIEAVLSIALYFSGRWKNEAYRRNEQK